MKPSKKILIITALFILFSGKIQAQITGPGGTFNTFSDVTSYLQGISSFTGDLVYEVMPGTYNEQVIMPYLPANIGGYKIIFQKKAGETGEVSVIYAPSGTDENYVIKVEGAHYVFDNINFQNNSDEFENKGTVLTFNGLNNYNEDNWFKNCKFTGITLTEPSFFSSQVFSVIRYSEDYYINNTQFENDTIIGGSNGIYLEHFAIKSYDIGIKNCIIKDFSYTGIYLAYMGNIIISGNDITSSYGDNSNPVKGIYLSGADQNANLSANKVDISSQSSKTCIELRDISTAGTYIITNNMLSTRDAGLTYSSRGIDIVSNTYPVEIYNNSIHIQDGYSVSSAIYNTDSQIFLFNNILANTGGGYSVVLNGTGTMISDFNLYYAANGYPIDEYGTLYYLSFWQTSDLQNLKDLNSIEAFPKFEAPDDLHILSSEYTYIEGRGDISHSPATDFDGQARDGSFPDIGADEGNFVLVWTGDILTNKTWHGKMFIEGLVTVRKISIETNGFLNILPGTELKFLNGAGINVETTLKATGLKGDSAVVFTAADTLQSWAGISHINSDSSRYEFCKFEFASKNNGGALYIENDNNVIISNSEFYKNTATYGGAIYTLSCTPVINSNFFNQNTAQEGGAIYCTVQESQIINNVFYLNSSTGNGGAIEIFSTSGGGGGAKAISETFSNNTFYNNLAGSEFGHDLYLDDTSIQIYNSIFWGDISGIRIYEINPAGNFVNACIIKDGFDGTNMIEPGIIDSNDPGFKNPLNLNFTLQTNSDAVNAGTYFTGLETITDYLGNPRIYEYSFGGQPDVGAFELQAPKLTADAGPDQSECNSTQYLINIYQPFPYTGTVTTNNPDVNILGMESTIYVTNLPPGTTEFYWTVTDGIVSETDTFLVINTQPYVNAGQDIFIVNNDVNDNIFPDTLFNANQPLAGQTGYWTKLSATSAVINNTSLYNSAVSNITYGQHLFKWTIDDAGCINSDSMLIIAGHSFVSAPDDGILDWNNPADWDVNAVPGLADSVTIFNCIANVNTSNTKCDRLIVGNGGTLNFEGTAKAPADLACRTIFIEQNAEKFKNVKGTANVHIGANSTVNIGSGYLAKALSSEGSGLYIYGGGSLFVDINPAKGIKGSAGLNIGSGGVIFIEQNAEKGVGNAEFHIGEGGYVFMEQNAEKKNETLKNSSNADLYIGSGGYVFIEQNAEKGVGGFLHLAPGRTMRIENPIKSASGGGHIGLYGGTIFIEQNAEKSTKSRQNPGIYLGTGGTIFIEQNAEKVLADASLIAPQIVIDGGKIKVGTPVKTKAATSKFQFRQIFIEQNAEKNITDTALIVYPSGGLYLSDTLYYGIPLFETGRGNAVTFEEGSDIKFKNNYFEEAFLNIDEGASFIDFNQTSEYFGERQIVLENMRKDMRSFITDSIPVSYTGTFTPSSWNESLFSWKPMPDFEYMTAGKGYLFNTLYSDTAISLYGNINQGDITVPVFAQNADGFDFSGWNALGNPYPSYLDLENITFPADISTSFYFTDLNTGKTSIYRQGGVSINGAGRYLAPSETFMIKTNADADFTFNNYARIHISGTQNIQPANILKLRITGNNISEETAILFDPAATDDYDAGFDAVLFPYGMQRTLFCSVLNDGTNVAINTLQDFTENKKVNLLFYTNTYGNYTLDVSEMNLDGQTTVTLNDLKTSTSQDLTANPTYNFTFEAGDDGNRFEILFGKASGIDDLENDNIKIYNIENTVFINSRYSDATAKVYDINGRLIKTEKIKKGNNSFNLNVAGSVYLVNVLNKTSSISKKIIITNR